MILPAGKLSGKGEKKRGEGRETRNPDHTHSSMCDVYKYKLSHICYKKPQNEKKKSSALQGEVPTYEHTAFSSLERCGTTPPGQTKHISLIRGHQDKFVITVSVSSFLPPKTYPATAGENKSRGGGGACPRDLVPHLSRQVHSSASPCSDPHTHPLVFECWLCSRVMRSTYQYIISQISPTHPCDATLVHTVRDDLLSLSTF